MKAKQGGWRAPLFNVQSPQSETANSKFGLPLAGLLVMIARHCCSVLLLVINERGGLIV